MKLFECQNCKQPLYFENTRCERCGLALGYLPEEEVITALINEGAVFRALAISRGRYRYCANFALEACNWLIRSDRPDQFCAACRHNRMIPDLSVQQNLTHWRMIEIAKHRLFYTLLKLRLPLVTRQESPDGLAFDFLAGPSAPFPTTPPVMTGHDNGLITLNLAEADAVERARQQRENSEPYRTLLGHFRHEIAHYYWGRLIADTPALDDYRRIFGDEREDYATALQNHYGNGASGDWPTRFVSAYASSHPWEDFAETWAHYFHMVDTLETASAFGLSLRPQVTHGIAARIDFDPHGADFARIIEAWIPLTFAANSINRSMGLPDLYPFLLPPPVIEKLAFVHGLIRVKKAVPIATSVVV